MSTNGQEGFLKSLNRSTQAMATLCRAGVVVAVMLMAHSVAWADYIDLTSAGATDTINGAVFIQGSTGSGTGVFPAFVQVTTNGTTTDAYNTTVNGVNDNGASDTFNHEIQLSDVPIYYIDSTAYYSFLLDVNEDSGQGDQFISLDQLIIITSTIANQSSTPLPTGTERYDMGAGNGVLLDYELGTGSGTGDMIFLVPVANFAGALGTDYVYLYSSFGALGTLLAGNPYDAPAGNYATSDGFEEWAFGPSSPCTGAGCGSQEVPVPEPGTLVLLGSGLAGLAMFKWKKSASK